MQLSDKEIIEIQKFKQHLQLLSKGPCQRPGDKACIDVPDSNFCASCYANSMLQTTEQTIETGEPLLIHLDAIATEPEMVVGVERLDKRHPIATDDNAKPVGATLEILLRFMGVLVAAFGETEAFKNAAATYGLKYYIKQ